MHNVAQTWFVLHETLYTIVLKWFYGFFSFFGTFAHKVAQTVFVLHETWHTTVFGIYYCVEVV